MSEPDPRQALREFISHELLMDETAALDDERELLLDGTIDSLGATRLVGYIERTWDIEIPPQHVTVENFRTIATMAGYVERRMANCAGS